MVRKWLLSFSLIFLALLLSVRPIAAHSDNAVLRLSNVTAGPFILNVWTYPSVLVTGAIHFSVSVLDSASGNPLPATAVYVEVTSLEGPSQTPLFKSRALLDFQSLLHEAYLDIQEPGKYKVTIQVAASSDEQGEVSFDLNVLSATYYQMMIIAFMIMTVIVSVWFIREGFRTWGIEGWIRRKLSPVGF